MAQPEIGIGHLTTQAHEFVKQHIEYDASARPEYVYTVRADAVNGTPCSVVRYAYVGATSRIEFMREYSASWNTAWDVF